MEWTNTTYRDSANKVRMAKTANEGNLWFRIPLRTTHSDPCGKFRLYYARGRYGHWTLKATRATIAPLIALAEVMNLEAKNK